MSISTENIFFEACFSGNDEVVRSFIAEGIYCGNRALFFATQGGHISTINLITKATEYESISWNAGLAGACSGGHLEIIKMMLDKGADDLIAGFQYASGSGNIDAVRFLTEKNDGILTMDCWNYSLANACGTGSLDIINFLISKGATAWNQGLNAACINGRLEIARIMIEKGATCSGVEIRNACYKGYIDIVKLLLDKCTPDLEQGLFNACAGGHMDIVRLLVDKGASDLNFALYKACEYEQIEIVEFLLSMGASKVNCCLKDSNNKEICMLLLMHGANSELLKVELNEDDVTYLYLSGVDTGEKYEGIVNMIIHRIAACEQILKNILFQNLSDVISRY